ncbi:dTDP-4-dehydrorhamnose reductase [Nitrincola nitratireducens]|nr:dTDP-4-dehydrorhamnose reductase [Nitrincola nitratireducens]
MPKQEPKQVLVTGVGGQLGHSIQDRANQYPLFDFVFVDHTEFDLADPNAISTYLADKAFDYILNCAAYTAVDKAESELSLVDQVNHLAVKQLAEWAQAKDAYLVHISTDYVFDGCHYQPYTESHPTDAINAYGLSKLNSEKAVVASLANAAVIRTSWVYSEYGNNFVKTMLRLGSERDQLNIIFDQIGSPTYAGDLADAMLSLISQHHQGLYSHEGCEFFHYSNEGVCSWYDFAKAIFELSDISCDAQPIETKDYPTPAKRPHFSLLNKAKIRQTLNVKVPYWKDSLALCLANLQENSHG